METFKTYAILSIAACTLAISPGTKTPDRNHFYYQDTLSTADFLSKTAVDYALEFNLAKQAKTNTKLSRIREYAVKVMDAYIVAKTEMEALALVSGLKLADTVPVPANIKKTLFARNKGGFDKNYLTASVNGHLQLVADYEKAVLSKDTIVSKMAEKHLLVIRRNLEMAKFLSKNIRNGALLADGPPREE